MKNIMKCSSFYAFSLLITVAYFLLVVNSCSPYPKDNDSGKTLHLTQNAGINTLDPALSADLTSSRMVGELYDTLLEYDYYKRPYLLKPSMLSELPKIDKSMTKYSFSLRDDLYFIPDKCFAGDTNNSNSTRKITSADIKFSFLRIADARLHSPGYWLIRNKIKGIGQFREKTQTAPVVHCDEYYDVYDDFNEGFKIIDDRHFVILLDKPDPRFLYCLTMPYMSIVPREALQYYKQDFAKHPVGSGPFLLTYWKRKYKIEFKKNTLYRSEFFTDNNNSDIPKLKLPLLDKVVVYNVDQPLSAWLMFLQGQLDISALSKDDFNVVMTSDGALIPALKNRGVQMLKEPKFQIYYIGFCFTDPTLAENLNLRKAISLAYNVSRRVKIFNHSIIPAQGPIPPGCAGYDPNFINPYAQYNITLAKQYLNKAGYPNGINLKTGKPLELTFDLGGNSTADRQIAELFVEDMNKIGVKIIPVLNSWPRFLQKSAKGEMQLFRVSWIGDYPDAENFLQLFYGPNAGACNRSYFQNKKFDAMFEEILQSKDSPDRTLKYKNMAKYITEQCPWIFAYYPTSYRLLNPWLKNYISHDFCFSQWKYLNISNTEKLKYMKTFKPLNFTEFK
jgi:ABC-type transport system substrate-binding protein